MSHTASRHLSQSYSFAAMRSQGRSWRELRFEMPLRIVTFNDRSAVE